MNRKQYDQAEYFYGVHCMAVDIANHIENAKRLSYSKSHKTYCQNVSAYLGYDDSEDVVWCQAVRIYDLFKEFDRKNDPIESEYDAMARFLSQEIYRLQKESED